LLEAVAALCPDEASLVKSGGSALDAALSGANGDWADLLPPWTADLWLGDHLREALHRRPDLVLTGRDLTKGADQPRTRLDHDVLEVAAEERGEQRIYLQLRLNENIAEIKYSFPEMREGLPADLELRHVRVEQRAPAPAAHPSQEPDRPSFLPKARYSADACRLWFGLRVSSWPGDRAAPSGEDCLAAVRSYFDGPIPRDPFLKIRKACVPREWGKQGRRKPQN
jgi:hypothetical protein